MIAALLREEETSRSLGEWKFQSIPRTGEIVRIDDDQRFEVVAVEHLPSQDDPDWLPFFGILTLRAMT